MDHIMFSIYDQKADAYLPPFILPRQEMAERTFSDCCSSPNHAFGRNPEDYTLVAIATFNDSKGKISPYEVPNVIGTGIEYRRDPRNLTGDIEDGDLKPISHDAPIQPGALGGNSS